MAVMTTLDLGISAVWHTSGFLHPRVMRNCFQIIVFASVHSVSLNQKPTDTRVLRFKPQPALLFQTLRNHRLTQSSLQIINSNKTITRIF